MSALVAVPSGAAWREVPQITWQFSVQLTAERFWVAATERRGAAVRSAALWTNSWPRPASLSELEALQAGITALRRAANDGRLQLR